MKLSIKIIESENEFIATCPELDINCYADNRNDAIKRIVNVLRFYMESARELGLEIKNFDAISIDGLSSERLPFSRAFHQKSEAIN